MNRCKTFIGNWGWLLQVLLFVGIAVALFYSGHALAETKSPAGTIAELADNIKETFASIAQLITATAYVAGFGFAIAAIFKFKQHKDNPTQIPMGTPIALVFIAAALIFLPTIYETIGTTVFRDKATAVGVGGTEHIGTGTDTTTE